MSRWAGWALTCSLTVGPAFAGDCSTVKHVEIASEVVSEFRSHALLNLPAAWPAQAPPEAPIELFEKIEPFTAEGAAGTLVLPAGAPDRRTPAIVILQYGEQPDDRASLYTDRLLGAGFAVLEMVYLPADGLEVVLTALALHPRIAGQLLGLLGFGAGARLAAEWSGPIGARAEP